VVTNNFFTIFFSTCSSVKEYAFHATFDSSSSSTLWWFPLFYSLNRIQKVPRYKPTFHWLFLILDVTIMFAWLIKIYLKQSSVAFNVTIKKVMLTFFCLLSFLSLSLLSFRLVILSHHKWPLNKEYYVWGGTNLCWWT